MSRQRAEASVFHAIADPTRRALLDLLRERERPVKELVERFRVRQPTISQHLRVLRDAALVSERRVGRIRLYRLEPERLRAVARWISYYQRFWPRKLTALADYLERQR